MDVRADKVRELRLSRGWSQEQLAKIADTTVRTIQRLESGSGASMETIKGLASAFGLDFQDLLLNSPQSNDVVDAEREQSEKEFARHATMRALQEETVSRVAEYWDAKTPGFVIAATALPVVEKWLSDFSIPEVMEAMDVSARQYLVIGPDGCCEKESLERAFQKIPAICFVNRQSKERPEIRDLYMIRGVFRNRIPGYFDNTKATQWLSAALNMGVPVEELRSLANGVRNWTQFRVALEELVQRHRILQEQRGAGPSPGSRAYLSAGSVSPSGATEDG
ncbi:MAG TPA: helix-turn-helix transcriptional regulator, partial [Bryobacteraceae bacterium]|nr:helix-turn-helix transcriptional regulator [Bryobacteraceae bacterium]